MWLSVAAFCGGGVTVFIGGFEALNQRAALKQEAKSPSCTSPNPLPNPALQGALRDKAAQRP